MYVCCIKKNNQQPCRKTSKIQECFTACLSEQVEHDTLSALWPCMHTVADNKIVNDRRKGKWEAG